ncbi:thiamine phosphate synthase [Akkermansiaceae bacterium]|nr:thiamine phosphate synthase [Akkermansiaceae bacterium]
MNQSTNKFTMNHSDALTIIQQCKLYAILDTGYVKEELLSSTLNELIQAGASVIQFRAKDYTEEQIRHHAKDLSSTCRGANVLFAMNDFADIAKSVSADILHIGQDDGSLAEARKIVGEHCLIGRSTHSPEQASQARKEGFDYIGYGPLFPTPTKKGRPGIGMETIAEVEKAVGSQIPVFCIGGVKLNKLDQIREAGATRVVIVSDLLLAESKKDYMTQVFSKLNSSK